MPSRTPGEQGSRFALSGAEAHYPPDLELEPLHLELSISLDIPAHSIAVRQRLVVRARGAAARSLSLDAVGFAQVAVELEGSSGRWDYDHENLRIHWDAPFAPGEQRVAVVSYRVVEPPTGLFFSGRGEPAQFAVTDNETERARYWLACVDHPSVRPTLRIELRGPAGFELLANGALLREEAHQDGTKTSVYEQRQPCPSYLCCFAAGNFARWEGGSHRAIPLAGFALPPYREHHVERSLRRTADMLAFLEQRLGTPYPFDKYYQFFAPGIGGAMENISLVSWDDAFLLDEALEQEQRQRLNLVNVHEMAHSWFGDSVGCRDHCEAWLKEGWATYLEVCWLWHDEGEASADVLLWHQRQAYLSEVDGKYRRPIVTRIYDTSFDLFDRHLYPGASWRIHMLRQRLGEGSFWAAVVDYLGSHGGGVVETSDFRRVLERHSGRSLARFFDQWFGQPGFPDLEVSFRHDAQRGEGTFEIVQKQVDAATGGGAFDFDLTIALRAEGEWVRRTVVVSGPKTVAVVPLRAEPERIQIDPDAALLCRLRFQPGVERLSRELESERAFGRIVAGRLLVESGRDGIERLTDAYGREACHGVRRTFLEALGEEGSAAALEALLRIEATEQDPRCWAELFRALGRYRDARLVARLRARVEAGLPPRAWEAALEAIGAQREAAPVDFLISQSERAGNDYVACGALRALGAARQQEGLDVLCRVGASSQARRWVRSAALAALGELGASLERRPRERALELLCDVMARGEPPGLAVDAASALGAAGARHLRSEMEATARRLPEQYAAVLRRVARDLGEEPSAGPGREHERLAEKVRRLEEELSRLAAQVKARQGDG